VRLPLSEEEQRVLNEMEQTLYRHDPAFAARVKSESVYRYAGRVIRWSVVGFILGLVIMILWFTTSIVVGLIGVAIMFASLVLFSTNLRRVGKAGWQDITHSLRNERIGNPANEARDWFRSRFRRDK
jgi:sulfite exporter TauE/SafE